MELLKVLRLLSVEEAISEHGGMKVVEALSLATDSLMVKS
jgi:hypothetical protein